MVLPYLDYLKQHDCDEDPHVLTIRYSYYPPIGALPNRCVSLFTAVAIGLLAKRVRD